MATASVLQSKVVEEVKITTATVITSPPSPPPPPPPPPPPLPSRSRSHVAKMAMDQASNNVDASNTEGRRCKACLQMNTLFLDWRAGDCVCTSCGVVQEGHLLDSRAEWREFHDADDIVRRSAMSGGVAAAARCSLMPDDPTRWLGGLQPTTLSSHVYGGTARNTITATTTSICGASDTSGTTNQQKRSSALRKSSSNGGDTRKLLLKMNHKIDRRMVKMHSSAVQNAKLSTRIRQRQEARRRRMHQDGDTTCDDDEEEEGNRDSMHLDHEQLNLQEDEEHAALANADALHADKWSLERAIRLFGSDHEQQQASSSEGADALRRRLDAKLLKASRDLYQAHTLLTAASRRLHLPDRVTLEASSALVRYASRRDGLMVRGVSSQLKSNNKRSRLSNNNNNNSSNSITSEAEKQAREALREYNTLKQSGSLVAALIFYTCRNRGWPRTLVEVCASIQPITSTSTAGTTTTTTTTTALSSEFFNSKEQFIKKKHCSRAMNEIKETFPEYAQTVAASSVNPVAAAATTATTVVAVAANADSNFVEHAIRNLRLPPVAEASVRTLVFYCRKQSWTTSASSSSSSTTKMVTAASNSSSTSNLSTICAAVSYFVCMSGETMQRLALQTNKSKQLRPSMSFRQARKRLKFSKEQQQQEQRNTKTKTQTQEQDNSAATATVTAVEDSADSSSSSPSSASAQVDDTSLLFQNAETQQQQHQQDAAALAEQRAYEMRRVWDAWKEQTPWSRTKAEIEHSCGVSRLVIQDFFKTHLYPNRFNLLKVLAQATTASTAVKVSTSAPANDDSSKSAGAKDQEALSSDVSIFLEQTPLASVLLPHITLAAPVIKEESN